MRYAIYFTPPPDDSLARAAARWLGRDAFTGEALPFAPVAGLSAAEVAFHTAAARRYGFHATLKAPFALAPGESEDALAAALDEFASSSVPVVLPAMTLLQILGFFALVPAARSEALEHLAGSVVENFDRFRAPMSEADIARRSPELLSPRQLRHLHRWGYPYVFEEFRFHMTLSGRVAGEEARRVGAAIEAHFGELARRPLEIGSLALFVEPEPGAPFTVRSLHAIGRGEQRKSA